MMLSVLSACRTALVGAALAVWALLLTTACASVQSHSAYQQGQIIDPTTNSLVPFPEFRTAMLEADVIYLGEMHYTPSHLEAAQQVLQTLLDEGQTLVLGMEMFSWDGQEGLTRFVNGELTTVKELVAESQWRNNWGGDYEDYAALVDFAKNHDLTLLGLNPPRSMVRKVVQHGLPGIAGNPDLKKWNMPDPFPPDDPDYRRVIYEQIEKCHTGLSQEIYQKIYEASVFRDEAMASVIATTSRAEASGSRTIVSYTGAGHMQYGLPIPKRVQRQVGTSIKDMTVYLHALDPEHPEDVISLIDEQIADFVWLTALGPQGRQPRCGE